MVTSVGQHPVVLELDIAPHVHTCLTKINIMTRRNNNKKNKTLSALIAAAGLVDPRLGNAMKVARGAGNAIARPIKRRAKKSKNSMMSFLNSAQNLVPAYVSVGKAKNPRRRNTLSMQIPQGENNKAVVKFMAALIDPWSDIALGASIPARTAGPSYKVKTTARFIVTAGAASGTNGYGSIVFAPSLASDRAFAVYSSTSAFAGDSLTVADSGATMSSAFMNLPATATQLYNQAQAGSMSGRIVSFGYRITYTGTESNKGGVYYMVSFASRASVAGMTATTLGAFPQCNVRAIDRNRLSDVTYPLSEIESAYSNAEQTIEGRVYYPFSNGDSFTITSGSEAIPGTLGILINSTVGNTFEVECVQLSEYIGRGAQQFATQSYSDSKSFEDLVTAMSELEAARPSFENGDSPLTRLNVLISQLDVGGNKALVKNGLNLRSHFTNTPSRGGGLYADVAASTFHA